VLITPDEEGFGIAVPDLPGCFSHAETWDTIQPMAHEAVALWRAVMRAGKPIPEPAHGVDRTAV
jgi:predicted RNase H-like HicB family nuclease